MISSKRGFCAVFLIFLRLGLTSFGGPIAHIGFFRKEFVENKRWFTEAEFAQLVAICQFLPGPASSQLGFTIGLIKAGWLGALSAFVAFTLPSAALMVAFAYVASAFSSFPGPTIIGALKLVACIVVADAVINMSKQLCTDLPRRLIAISVFIFLLTYSSLNLQIAVLCLAALLGVIFIKTSSDRQRAVLTISYSRRSGVVILLAFVTLLLTAALVSTDAGSVTQILGAFYQIGALVFGGGHVVLPLLSDAVVAPGLVSNEQFLAGYGAAQALPGPLFTISAFLGALIPSDLNSLFFASLTVVAIFLPGFLLVSGFLPFWNQVMNNRRGQLAVAGTNAGVVGLLAAALYDPILISSVSSVTNGAIVLFGILAMQVGRVSPLYVVLGCLVVSVLLGIL